MSEPGDEYADQAKSMVNEVIQNALRRLETGDLEREKTSDSLKSELLPPSRETTLIREEDYEVQNIKWLTIEEFSPDAAEKKINEFIETWEYENSWLYCVDFMGEDDHEFDRRFQFRVRWSIPTRRKPIPRATASVYFTFIVSKIKPKNYPVEVLYVFETNRLVHRPGMSRFREKWLKDIIESKVIMMSAVTF
ncbi:A-kinase anchor protein 14-like [Haliotis rufescens]|uniref:A-kinase anchor protein 14-like n=1 Tax=Haliotis rufescens TaxID=6454 RepID=UPI00201F56C1|nr:A-kinase anchor protein 14-like [Haliotis rufescens]